jgi:cytochrome c553
MKSWIKWVAIALGLLLLLAAAAVAVGVQLAERKAHRFVDVPVRPVAYREDAASLDRGRYLFQSRGCAECHGANGSGRVVVDEGNGLHVKAPNITRGAGGVVAAYQPQDWVRAIRHGIAPGGRALLIMPSEDYNRFTDDDLAAVVAHVRSLPPAAGGPAEIRLPVPVRVLYAFGGLRDAAEKIDHTLPPQAPVAEGVTVQHGAYVANMCIGCHGAQLVGGRIPGAPPDWPAAPRLRPGDGSVLPAYGSPEALLALFRSGKRGDGSAVKVMPFESLRALSDTDVRALHMYLQSLPRDART